MLGEIILIIFGYMQECFDTTELSKHHVTPEYYIQQPE